MIKEDVLNKKNPQESSQVVSATVAATIIGTSDGMLSHWRKKTSPMGSGPPFKKVDGNFYYRIGDIVTWSEKKVLAEKARHNRIVERAKIEITEE